MATVKGVLTGVSSHVITAATTIAALGLVNPEDVKTFIEAIHQFNDGLAQTVGALGKMWIVIGPLAAWFVARLGITNPTVQNLLATLTKMATSGTNAEQTQKQADIASATAELPKVTGVVAPELAAVPSTPGNVVSTPAAL
jgi:hypothetical protein